MYQDINTNPAIRNKNTTKRIIFIIVFLMFVIILTAVTVLNQNIKPVDKLNKLDPVVEKKTDKPVREIISRPNPIKEEIVKEEVNPIKEEEKAQVVYRRPNVIKKQDRPVVSPPVTPSIITPVIPPVAQPVVPPVIPPIFPPKPPVVPLSPADKDPGFDTGVPIGVNDDVVAITEQCDGKILLGGDFTSYQGTRSNRLIRLNIDGTIDTTFNIGTGFDSRVTSIVVQNDCKILVGGWFKEYGGAYPDESYPASADYVDTSANGIVRLNIDGSRDNTFDIGVGFDNLVSTIALQNDGKILVGGKFYNYQDISANGIIRLNTDGSRDETFDMGNGFYNGVKTIFIDDNDKIFVGLEGYYSLYKDQSVGNILLLNVDGSRNMDFNADSEITYGYVDDIAIQNDGKLLVGGYFSNSEYQKYTIIRLNIDGTKDSTFDTGASFGASGSYLPNVVSIALQSDGKILVGGLFNNYQDIYANYIIRLDSNGNWDNSFNIESGFAGAGYYGGEVKKIYLSKGGKILVGGTFNTYKGETVNGILMLDNNGNRDLDFYIGNGFNNSVQKVAIQEDNKILAGGLFTIYKGVEANRLIRLNIDGSRDNTFDIGSGFNKAVYAMALQSDGKILVGGEFTEYKGNSANGIIRLNTDGSIDTTFNIGSGFSGSDYFEGTQVRVITIQSDNRILVGGEFKEYSGDLSNNIIRLNTDGSIDNTFDIGSGFTNLYYSYYLGTGVRAISTQIDGKILVGGWFNEYNNNPVIGVIRLNTDGSIDNTFDTVNAFGGNVYLTSFINSIIIQNDNKILVGGSFYNSGYESRQLIRLNPDGSKDNTFDVGNNFNGTVNNILVQSDNKILVGGGFTEYQGVSASRIIRLNNDGSKDISFDMGRGLRGPYLILNNKTSVNSLVLQKDGKILVGGGFFIYKNRPAPYLIRLNN